MSPHILTQNQSVIEDPRKVKVTIVIGWPSGAENENHAQRWVLDRIQIPLVLGLGSIESVQVTVITPTLPAPPKGPTQ